MMMMMPQELTIAAFTNEIYKLEKLEQIEYWPTLTKAT
jgi:hypothetical protein